MTTDDLVALKTQITASEARKPYLYDDATGKRITKGSVVVGHPTWGIGFNCDAIDFTDAAIDAQYEETVRRVINEVVSALPWVVTLPINPLRAIIDIAYNAGMEGLIGFHKMLGHAQHGNFPAAGHEILNSQLAPARKTRLAKLMTTL